MSDSGGRDVNGAGQQAPRWRAIGLPDEGVGAGKRIAHEPEAEAEVSSGLFGHKPPVRQESCAPTAKKKRVAEPDPRRKALELLTRREHSHRELVSKLRARGFDPETAENTVDEMAARGWQDETRFAQALARSRAGSGHGPIRIRAELQQHAIKDELIETALAACEVDWREQAVDLLQRRFGPGRPADRKEYARRGAFLQRRGYDLDAIRHALARFEA